MTAPRDFRLLVGAVGLSALGDWLALVPLALHIEATTGSGLAVAALFIALWLPAVALAGVAGPLVDRLETTRLLALVSLAQAVVAVALPFTDGLAPVLGLVALLGAGAALAQPAEFALVPAVAGEARLAEANGRVETARYLGFTAGPLLGGLLAAGGGTTIALLVNAASFAAVAAAACALRVRRRPRGGAAEHARGGLALLAQDRVLALVVSVVVVSLAVMAGSITAELFFATDVLEVGETGYGVLVAAWTVGMVGGAVAVAPRIRAGALVLGALVATAVQGAGLALSTVWLAFPVALAFYVVGGLGHGAKNVLIRTLIHEAVPDRLRGRAFAAYNGLRNGAELVGLATGGLLVTALGPRHALLLAGAIPVVVALAGLSVLLTPKLEEELA